MPVSRQIAMLEQRKFDAVRHFGGGSLPSDVLRTMLAELDQRIDAQRQQQVTNAVDVMTVDRASSPSMGSNNMPVGEQHAALRLYLERIVVQPAGKGQRVFSPDLIDLHWRDLW